jgi:hypothetical protein
MNEAPKPMNEVPKVPSVDRKLKPNSSNSSLSSMGSAQGQNSQYDFEKEKADYEFLMARKKLALEEIDRLEKRKQQEAKETAQLMRSRRKVEEDMKEDDR